MAKAGPNVTTAPFATPSAGAGAAPNPGAAASASAPGSAMAAQGAARGGGMGSWIPALVAIVAAPALTWAVGQFVLIPQLQKKLSAPAAEAGEVRSSGHEGAEGKGGSREAGPTFEFQNIVVNLAGTMGTRYLKTTFLVTGADPNVKSLFEGNKAKLTDVTLNVLSSLSLADLEEPGAKNVLREKLVTAYNQTLGRKVADQVYFSDFVVQ